MQVIETLITPTLKDLGYETVRVRMMGANRPTLQVMVEKLDECPMTLEDCVAVSRTISVILDVEDPISGSYTLEVSSPGLDRPLVRERDFVRFSGLEAKIELTDIVDGHRRYRGILLGCKKNMVTINTNDGVKAFPFNKIGNANLVINDDLLEAGSVRATKHERA